MNAENYCTFYLTRHGETDMNVAGQLQGQTDSKLTEKGRGQALALATELKDVHFDAIFASDLSRAKDTADIIATEHNLATQTSQLLRERAWGRLEGSTREVLEQFDEVYAALNSDEKKKYKSYEEIETDEELASRYITFIREVAVANPGKNILLVSHGSAIGTFLVHGYWHWNET